MNYKVSDPRFWEERRKSKDGRANTQRMQERYGGGNKVLNEDASTDEKADVSTAVFDSIGDWLFDHVAYLNHIYTDFGGGGTTSTTNLATDSRIIDSSQGLFMRAGNKSRLSCQFYTKNGAKLQGYILSPATLDSDSLGTITDLSGMDAYAGLYFDTGDTYVATKDAGGSEVLTPIDFSFDGGDATFSTTYALQMIYTGAALEIHIGGEFKGSYAVSMQNTSEPVYTYYPFFSAGKSTDGTQVNIVAETLQFIQDR